MKREPYDKSRVSSGTQKWITVPAPHVTPVVLLFNARTSSDMKIVIVASICDNNSNNVIKKHKTKQVKTNRRLFYEEIIPDITTWK